MELAWGRGQARFCFQVNRKGGAGEESAGMLSGWGDETAGR